MRAETIYCTILLALEVLLAFLFPGTPVAGPAVGVFVALFLGTLAADRETACKLRYVYAFFLGLIAAAANKGSFEHVTLAVAISVHFFTWTEGFTENRRYAIKKGEPLPPDGRRAIYSLAFCAAVALSYLFLDGIGLALPLFLRGLLGFVAIVCGFCLWDIGYVTRLQRATRFRRPTLPTGVRAMQILVVAAIFAVLFLIFGRAIPTAASAMHEAASELRKGTGTLTADPLRADRDRSPETDQWTSSTDQLQPHQLPAEGDFEPDDSLLLAMAVPNPEHRDALLNSRVYVRAYALRSYSNDEWGTPDKHEREILTDLHDGNRDGRVVVDGFGSVSRSTIFHEIRMLEPFQQVLPALQGVSAYHLSMVGKAPGDWYTSVSAQPSQFGAESLIRTFIDFKGENLNLASNFDRQDLTVPRTQLFADMRQLVAGLRDLPLERRVDSVVELLNERCDYSLSIRNPGKFPALQNFLYGEKQGFCIHYATAAALLLRLADVPARVAFGFSGGEYYDDEDVFAFRGQDSHVWVEILLENYGWTVVDPTPAGNGAAHNPTRSDAPDDYLRKIAGETDEPESNSGRSIARWLRQLRELPWGVITGTMLAAIFLIAFLISWRQRNKERAQDDSVLHFTQPDQDHPKYLREFYRACSRRFGVQKSHSETLQEFIDQLKRAGALRDEFDGMCDYHYRISYCDVPRDKGREDNLRKQAKNFEAAGRE